VQLLSRASVAVTSVRPNTGSTWLLMLSASYILQKMPIFIHSYCLKTCRIDDRSPKYAILSLKMKLLIQWHTENLF